MFTKVAAMQRITESTDRRGLSVYPSYMNEAMEGWAREGLITLGRTGDGITYAKITDKGRKLAKKAMATRA